MRHNGHIRQRSESSYELRYSLGTDPLTGKWKVKTVTFKGTRKAAQRELQRILDSLEENSYIEPNKLTTAAFLQQWLETIRGQVSLRTYERYADNINSFLIPKLGDHLLCKLAPATIQQAYNVWEKSGRRDSKKGGLAPRTRLHLHRVLKSALKHAVQLQLIARNPADVVKPPRAKKASITTLDVEQSAALLDAICHTRLYLPVLLALTTGMRRGEILALRWKNVDLELKTVRVVESLEHTSQGIRFKAPKTEKTRAIILPDYVVEELRGWKRKQAEELSEQEVIQTDQILVCGRRDGEPRNPTTITHEFMAAIKKLTHIPKIRFHDLRHSHATQLLTAGIHPKIAQERLGHSTITTTLDLYSHATDTMQSEAAIKLDTAFRSAIKTKRDWGQGPEF